MPLMQRQRQAEKSWGGVQEDSTERYPHSQVTHLLVAQAPEAPEAAQSPSQEQPKRNKSDHYDIIKFPQPLSQA